MLSLKRFSGLKSTVFAVVNREYRSGLSGLRKNVLFVPQNPAPKSFSTLVRKDFVALNRCANYILPSSSINRGNAHASADEDLSAFLEKEVALEKKMSKVPKTGSRIPGFELREDGSNLVLTKTFKNETIVVKANVNGSVIASEGNVQQQPGGEPEMGEVGEMKAKPDFTVEIKKPNGRTLVMNCTFYEGPEDPESVEAPPEAQDDLFQIENFYIMRSDDLEKDEWKENTYMGDGGLVDGEMYDLLMNYLDERGINNEFAEALVEYSTFYEHNQYIRLLSNLKEFVEGK